MSPTEETFANAEVLAFYKTLPFNYYDSTERQAESVKNGRRNIEANLPLPPLLQNAKRVLDVGCGAGWLTNSIAYHFGCAVTGIDFNPVAVERASAVAAQLGLKSQIECADLFRYSPAQKFDLVISLGVLHHTDNCAAAVRHLLRETVENNGSMYIGLYHTYGRAPFLNYFEELKAAGRSEEYLFQKYKELSPATDDEEHLRSWFRDQVLHPHESQHTLKEMAQLISEEGATVVSTSINRFQPIEDMNELFILEKEMERAGEEALRKKRYFPGFFTFLVEKR